MKVVLYRQRLDLKSGVGQLIRTQAAGLARAGARVRIRSGRGALRFALNTALPALPIGRSRVASLDRPRDGIVVDHGMALLRADFSYVHNLASERCAYLSRDDIGAEIDSEVEYFGRLSADTRVIANSELVRRAVVQRFNLDSARVDVQYPGYQSHRFMERSRSSLRRLARRELGVEDGVPIVGFVTSGDLRKRGLDIFLACAERIAREQPSTAFLVVGGRELPTWARGHGLVANGRIFYRPKNRYPERWMATLDVFLYPARFEEFGLVVVEAQALGVPVVTSRRVGAAECLAPELAPWLTETPDAEQLSSRTLALLEDSAERDRLSSLGARYAHRFDDKHYAMTSARMILG